MSLCNFPNIAIPNIPDILAAILALLPGLPSFPTIPLPVPYCPLDG